MCVCVRMCVCGVVTTLLSRADVDLWNLLSPEPLNGSPHGS